MVNPDDLIENEDRTTTLVEFAEKSSLKEEAFDESLRNRRLFRKDTYGKRAEEIFLPILIVPGVASSGLYVQKSSVDEKYVGQRVWMNAAFLAMARLNNHKEIVTTTTTTTKNNDINNTSEREAESPKKSNFFGSLKKTFGGASAEERLKDFKQRKNEALSQFKQKQTEVLTNLTDMVKGSDLDEQEEKDNQVFSKVEEDIAVKNTWIQHIALDTNMIDEKPGNEVRVYDGLKGCEYLVDSAIEKTAGALMGPLVDYCVDVLHYERGKSIDAAPYDWRLAPSITERRDGQLTKMVARVERMYEENDGLPIVLVCHSMGVKMGHYFLNFCLQHKGEAWLAKYIHTWMPVGAPHAGVGCAVRCGITGAGLNETVDMLVGNRADGLIMYRSWSCGNWLMPRMLPKGVLPTCIVRREGELGLTLTSEIEVGSLFCKRDKLPKELRLTVTFRDRIRAHTEYSPLVVHDDGRMTVSFHETFYLAVPYLGDDENIGEVVLYLEEPAGRVAANKTDLGKKFSQATRWARSIKKRAAKFARDFAKKWGTVLRVAVVNKPLVLHVSDFQKEGNHYGLKTTVSIVGCHGGSEADEIVEYSDSGSSDSDDDDDDEDIKGNGNGNGNASPKRTSRSISIFGGRFRNREDDPRIGSISLQLSYSPHPAPTGTQPSETPIAMIHEETPTPLIKSKPHRFNTSSNETVEYDVWNGTDVYKADGFIEPMFDLVKNQYEGDPLGPSTKSSLDAPPVQCVRAIYGINIPTEAGAVYRKVPVVTVGDREADCRYMLDRAAAFPSRNELTDDWNKEHLHTYDLKGGIIYETPETLQTIPFEDTPRKVCGDGTVPYWNMVHALSWKNDVETLTVDELDKAGHKDIVMDERFFALVKRYAKVVDPRMNAMKLMKQNFSDTSGGIGTLAMSVDHLTVQDENDEE